MVTRLLYVVLLLLVTSPRLLAQEDATLSLADAALRGPAVASVLEMSRTTPAEQLNAVFILLDLDETDVAALVWKELTPDAIDEATQAELVTKFGTGRFLNLARREATLSGVETFARSCLDAATKRGRDPQRLAKLIATLDDPSDVARGRARADLALTGDAGAVACLEALAKAKGEQLRTQLLLTLARMRPGVEPLLLAAVADGQGQFRRDVVELTGYLYMRDAVPWLAALAAGADSDEKVVSAAYAALTKMKLSLPSADEARALIRSEIHRLRTHQNDLLSQDAENPTWWVWNQNTPPVADPGPGKFVSAQYSSATITKLKIRRLASLLLSLDSPSGNDLQTELLYYFETAEFVGQSEKRELEEFSVPLLSDTLALAIKQEYLIAAVAIAKELGERSDTTTLRSVDGRPSPLAAAVAHGNRNLRYAAVEAIMKISPSRSFAGASGVPPALWALAASAGAPQVVVGSSVRSQAGDWAGQLRGLGYEALPAVTGREALRLAFEAPRLELFLIDSDVGRPLVREVVYQLRNNSHTSQVPVAVLSSVPNLPRARHLAEHDTRLLAIPRPHTQEAIESVLARLKEIGGNSWTAKQRSERALQALGWLTDLLEKGHPYDELLRGADVASETLYHPELSAASMRLLTVLGTAGSQRSLADYASSKTTPIELRQQAAEAFAKSVQRFGKLLTREEVRRQYDLYNAGLNDAGESVDEATQEVLSQVLDVLEK